MAHTAEDDRRPMEGTEDSVGREGFKREMQVNGLREDRKKKMKKKRERRGPPKQESQPHGGA